MDKNKNKKYNAYIRIWLGQLFSILGSGITAFGLGVWLCSTSQRTSPIAIMVLFATIPYLIFGPIAGVIADKLDKKAIMIIADVGSALSTVVLMILALNHQLVEWHIYLGTFFNATFGVFQSPALSASVLVLVPKEKLSTANGLNQISNSCRLLMAPILGGLIFAFSGLYGIFFVDFATFIIGVASIIFVPKKMFNIEKSRGKASEDTIGGKWKEWFAEAFKGFKYIAKHKGLMALLFYFAVVNFFINISMVLITPLSLSFGDSNTTGIIAACGGLGMMVGSFVITARKPENNLIKRICTVVFIEAIFMMFMGIKDSLLTIALGRFLFMMCVPVPNTAALLIWQRKAPLELQGRLFAARNMIVRTVVPIAYLIVGPIVDSILKPFVAGMNPNSFVLPITAGLPYRIIFIVSGVLLVLTSLGMLTYKPFRRIEDLPDCHRELEVAATKA